VCDLAPTCVCIIALLDVADAFVDTKWHTLGCSTVRLHLCFVRVPLSVEVSWHAHVCGSQPVWICLWLARRLEELKVLWHKLHAKVLLTPGSFSVLEVLVALTHELGMSASSVCCTVTTSPASRNIPESTSFKCLDSRSHNTSSYPLSSTRSLSFTSFINVLDKAVHSACHRPHTRLSLVTSSAGVWYQTKGKGVVHRGHLGACSFVTWHTNPTYSLQILVI